MGSVTYPNQTTLLTNALSPQQVQVIFQVLTAQMIGLNPQGPKDPAYRYVRLGWPQNGQPAWDINSNYVFIRAVEQDADYGRVYDGLNFANPSDQTGESILQQYSYNRVWQIIYVFYGNGSALNAQFVRDGMILDWVKASLAISGLYVHPAMARPRRTRELFENRWWERFDLRIDFNEVVTNSIVLPSIGDVEIKLYTQKGLFATIDVNLDGYGEGGMGWGGFGGQN